MIYIKFRNSFGLGTVANAALAIETANQLWDQGFKMRLMNGGWGSAATSALLQTAIAHAATRGILIVAGAGNITQDNDGAISFFPASYPNANIIAVAATDNQDKLASFL